MFVAMSVQSHLSPMEKQMRMSLPTQQFEIIKNHDLGLLIQPYILIGAIVVIMLVIIALKHMPHVDAADTDKGFLTTIQELIHRKNYREGILAEFCYVGVQAACWTYIIQYGTRIFVAEGMTEQEAEVLSLKYNIIAMVLFAGSRFICTWLMQWFTPGRMLSTLAIIGMGAMFGAICFTDRNGIYCLVAVSGCLSLMFPTIYGIALRGIGENVKIAGAGLIMRSSRLFRQPSSRAMLPCSDCPARTSRSSFRCSA